MRCHRCGLWRIEDSVRALLLTQQRLCLSSSCCWHGSGPRRPRPLLSSRSLLLCGRCRCPCNCLLLLCRHCSCMLLRRQCRRVLRWVRSALPPLLLPILLVLLVLLLPLLLKLLLLVMLLLILLLQVLWRRRRLRGYRLRDDHFPWLQRHRRVWPDPRATEERRHLARKLLQNRRRQALGLSRIRPERHELDNIPATATSLNVVPIERNHVRKVRVAHSHNHNGEGETGGGG